MDRQLAAGPSATAEWASPEAGTPEGSLPILVLADAANDAQAAEGLPPVYYVLPRTPRVARDRRDRPIFSVALVLSGRPKGDDDTIYALVESGRLTCDLTLAVAGVPNEEGTLLPLYAKDLRITLEGRAREAPGEEDSAEGQGASTRVGFSTELDAASARAVLLALNGMASDLRLRCDATYRTAASRHTVHLAGEWAAIYEFLSRRVDRGGGFTLAALDGHLRAMAKEHLLRAWIVEPSGLEHDTREREWPAVLEGFLKIQSVILQPAPAAPADPLERRFALGNRPDSGVTFNLHLGVTVGGINVASLTAPLESVFGGLLTGFDADSFITLSYAGNETRGIPKPVPKRMRNAATRDAPGEPRTSRLTFVPVGDALFSISRALVADSTSRAAPHALLASDAVRPQGPTHAFAVDHAALLNAATVVDPQRFLPFVFDPEAPYWGNQPPTRFWYAPEFRIAPVDLAADPDSSPFQFTFSEMGHDAGGRPVLEGEVMFSLISGMSPATQSALQAVNRTATPVPTTGLSVVLGLPVRDDSGRLRQIDLLGTIERHEQNLTVRVPLLNDYLRVAYGDLAFANFQPKPAALKIAYTFEAMVQAPDDLPLQYVGKIVATKVAYTDANATALRDEPFVDARTLAYRSPAADLVFQREGVSRAGPAAAVLAGHGAGAAIAVHPAAVALAEPVVHHPPPTIAMLEPRLEAQIRLQDLLRQRRYVQETQLRTASVDVVFPCNTYGAFYRQDRGGEKFAIGCQSSFSLGQTALKWFELVTDAALASSLYRVYRSLTQPGRFMVVPTAYRISRYAVTEGARAYRPMIYLYSSLDAEHAENNRCIVMAMLQPDVPEASRKELSLKLAALHHSPIMQYVTEIDADVSYTWALDGAGASIQPQAARLWDGFQISLSTDLPGGLQLQGMLRNSGVAATARFTLGDGTTLNTDLVLDLSGLTGPWAGGPLETVVQGARAMLNNRIERDINVSDLAIYPAAGAMQRVRVDRLIAHGQSASVDLPIAPAEVYPVFTLQPGDPAELSEVNSFVEDIHTNVVFVNLINYANHNLARLDLRARLKEVPGSEKAVPIGETEAVSEAGFIMPLTTYLGPRTLEYMVTSTDTASHATTTGWLQWDLAARGNVVSLTWESIGGTS